MKLPAILFLILAPATVLSADQVDGTSLEAMTGRLAELNNNPPIPENQVLILDEIRQISTELSTLRKVSKPTDMAAYVKEVNTVRTKMLSAIDEFLKKDLSKLGINELRELDQSLVQSAELTFDLFDFDLTLNPPSKGLRPRTSEELKDKAAWITYLQGSYAGQKRQQYEQYFVKLATELSKVAQEDEAVAKQAASLKQALEKRKLDLQKRLSEESAQSRLSGSLWIVILAIGAVSLLTILSIRLFETPLQLEWVASGQVIQFVTVMILLSVILGLGLTGVIKENTLGTLLGGIGGYVLSQGVGRAAARSVERLAGTGDKPP